MTLKKLKLDIYGESHAPRIGMRLEGFPAGAPADLAALQAFMERRAPGRDALSTARREPDVPVFTIGLADGRTTGGVIEAYIANTDTRSGDYERTVPRPGHADWPSWAKTGRIPPGGGANSGRMTAAMCIAGGLCIQELARRGVSVSTRMESVGDIQAAKAEGDSVGGVIECTVKGLRPGVGGPMFDGLDGAIAFAVFGVPGVKGVEFGNGFGAASLKGSENNDPFAIRDGRVVTLSNRHGGVLGGMASGMDVVFHVAMKPTPSIYKPQRSVDLAKMEETELVVRGRHDPCIALRAMPAIEAVAAIAVLDALLAEESGVEFAPARPGGGIDEEFIAGLPNIVVDSNVAALHPAIARKALFVLPAGEENKTPATVARLWEAFGKAGLGRKDCVTAVGGGVTGDLTGFAAATWMRGIDWINVPTTLLSMVDASYGGKTACDLPAGKNLAGAFHPPRRVVIDAGFLETLPPERMAEGRAEMIKHEIIGALEPGDASRAPDAEEIRRNLAVKIGIVRSDPMERTGERAKLNCGHTVAHALEKATGYGISHGAAVAIGCVEEARLAERLGLAKAGWADSLAERFAAAGLPVALPEGVAFESLRPFMKSDKKNEGGKTVFALPCGPGDVRIAAF
ncbi:MAG: chorismate synthase [Kiritimatiellae bacterium]|nr:chorismate synthase [Kiritimatiellia bacterium]